MTSVVVGAAVVVAVVVSPSAKVVVGYLVPGVVAAVVCEKSLCNQKSITTYNIDSTGIMTSCLHILVRT